MLILGQHIRVDQALDWRQEDRVLFSSLPLIFGTTFREHSPLPAFFLFLFPVLCTLWGTETRAAATGTRTGILWIHSHISTLPLHLIKPRIPSAAFPPLFLRFAPAAAPSLQDVTGAGTRQNSPWEIVITNI